MKDDSEAETKKTRQPRSVKKRARTRDDLLAAARKVFARRGYHDTSILDITEEADVGVGTFYLHFRDKDEVFRTLIDEVLAILESQVITEVRKYQTLSVEVIIHSILRHAYDQRDLFRIALTGGQISSAMHIEDVIAQGFLRVIEQGASLELQGVYDLPLLARFVTGIIAQGIIWWFDQDKPEPNQMAEQMIQLLRYGLPARLFPNLNE
jgi:AcrR family transcriptional regulator